ncbi:hypothetical protein HH308_04685 [Gordonia sp. TBRC 11910]|uniref:Uncharacterized protein n=1 Tax=Gordonia asplenii TaxID=2725283 RepID=A0A848KR33_9ACTN|nr:hypothetical protein [Gordonia asplenii]NMO00509.1 hypothetical protein [Gordonia asplenii]
MRRRVLIAVLAATTVMLAACGTDTDTPAATSSADTAQSADSAAAASDPLVGQWIGTWSSNGENRQAILNVGKANPLRATIDIPGRCGADWVESSRTGDKISVDATVTYGACSDNRWSVVLGNTQITATDPDNGSNTLRFTKH